MSTNVHGALDEAGKVVKKQRTCAKDTNKCLDELIALAKKARDQLQQSSNANAGVVCADVHRKVGELGFSNKVNASTKELHSSINKLGKALDKTFDAQQDICKAMRDVKFDEATLNKVIAEHFYREGRFELGELFVSEAGVEGHEGIKQPYTDMHTILREIRAHNLLPALDWARRHREQLAPTGGPSAFEFQLHSLYFTHLLATQGHQSALRYGKQHFSEFQSCHMPEIQRLMGCLLFASRPPEQTPYADLMSLERWEGAAREFARQACSLMGRAYESPLAVTVAAGSVALPGLLKLANVMERNGQDLRACEQLPIELELGDEFVFHSIFACPVSRDQSSADNPPMLLPCNHVLCEQSILKIAKSRSRVFKCPYCPMEARADNLRPLIFPDGA